MTEEFDTQAVLKQVVRNIQEAWASLDQQTLQGMQDGEPDITYSTTRVQNILEGLLTVEIDGESREIGYSSEADSVHFV